MLVASQLFWVRRILDLGERFIPGKPRRDWLAVITGAVYLFIKWGPIGLRGCNFPVSGTLRGKGRARMVSFPTVYQRVFVHWRVIILLVLALAALLIAYADFFDLFLFALLLLFQPGNKSQRKTVKLKRFVRANIKLATPKRWKSAGSTGSLPLSTQLLFSRYLKL
jgi:hypothetical protein